MTKATNTPTLTLDRRPGELGKSLNGRTEMHGDESVPACDVTLSGLLLAREEIDALLGRGSYSQIFTNRMNSGMSTPEPSDFVRKSKTPFELDGKFEDCRVVLYVGMDLDELVLDPCDIAKIKYEPQVGGLTHVSVQVQCTPDSDIAAELFAHLDTEVECEVRFGKIAVKDSKQRELPITTTDGKKDSDASDDRPAATH
jgi:hypothetical protein